MWYKIDINKFGVMLLPPVLRKSRMYAFLKVLLCWFGKLQNEFNEYREDARKRLGLNGQVIYIEKALNDYFGFESKEIYITDISSIQRTFYVPNDEDTAYIYDRDSLKVAYLSNGSENAQLKFIVNVPSSLEDRIEDIRNIIDYNKPAGRTYTINFYDYE